MTGFLTNLTVWQWVVAAGLAVGAALWRKDRLQLIALADKVLGPKVVADIGQAATLLQALAPDAVLFVEHALPGASGAEKFAQAVSRLVAQVPAGEHTPLGTLTALAEQAVQGAYAAVKTDGRLAASSASSSTTGAAAAPVRAAPASLSATPSA